MSDLFSNEILAQVIGIFAASFIIGGYAIKDDVLTKKIIVVGALLFTIHFFMLGALPAALMNLINSFRVALSIKLHKSKVTFSFFIMLYLLSTVFTYDSWVDILPLISSLLSTFSMYFLSGLKFRYCVLIGSSCWLMHNIIINSIGGVVTELFVLIATFLVIYRLLKDKRNAV